MTPWRQRRVSLGQASIEYLVVLAFGVMVLLKPFSYTDVSNPNAPATEAPALQQLAKAVKDYHKHYTFAMSIATIPECDYNVNYSFEKTLPASIATLTGEPLPPSVSGSVSIDVDRCIDWGNPAIPAVQVESLLAIAGIPTNFSGFVQAIVDEMITSAMNKFTDPANLAEMVGFPTSASDIIKLILP
ncbi:MAG: hypothetical protein K9K30_01700 [Burkholderiaceae bacterium]|nr:hypothetical protein [Sulfuritalea sp.]MCF8173930.1 hypothetical protein [Burkholderiaceae bacterium]